MQIDTNTIAILKNFAKINNSILINEGNILKTISQTKTIVGKAAVSTSFEKKFAVYNLDRFLAVLGLFKDPKLTFEDRFVNISDENKSLNFTYADEATVSKAPEKDLVLPSQDVVLRITNDDLKDVEKALGIMQMPEIIVSGDGTSIFLQTADSKNPSGDIYSVKIGETEKTFKCIFKSENIKVIPGDYQVVLCSKGISHWKSDVVEYYIAVEATSTF